jgi:hypothetical protein
MKSIQISKVTEYVEKNIGKFHSSRLDSLSELKLQNVLKHKNPYLFKAKNILLSQELVRNIVDAYLSSQEETIFGSFLEGLAIFINGEVYGGQKSGIPGMDLEFVDKGIRYIVDIKSGPNWGNSSQIRKMKDNFKTAKITIRGNNPKTTVVAINGCCYGKDNKPDKGEYFKYCGQQFWEFISHDAELYLHIIVPLGHKAKEKNAEFYKEYSKLVNKFTDEFSEQYCKDGTIDWESIVKLNSAKSIPKKK